MKMKFEQGKSYRSKHGIKATCVGHKTDGRAILEFHNGEIAIADMNFGWSSTAIPEGWRMMNIPYKDGQGDYRMVGYVIPWETDSINKNHLHWQIDDVQRNLDKFRETN
jgi:hypothetical protein